MSSGPILIDKTNQCRVCNSECGELRLIENKSYKFPEKAFSELLLEVTRVEVHPNETPKIPKFICLDCVSSLHDAYSFIQRVRRFEEQWQKFINIKKQHDMDQSSEITFLNNSSNVTETCLNLSSDSECDVLLLESDQDDVGREMKIEYEHDAIEVGYQSISQEPNESNLENENPVEDTSREVSHSEQGEQSFVEHGHEMDATQESQRSQLESSQSGDYGNSSFNSQQSESVKRKRGRPRTKGLPNVQFSVNADGRFVCSVCSKIFVWRKDLYRHYHSHNHERFSCNICGQIFNRKDKLKIHMEAHKKLRPHSTRWLFGNLLYNDKPHLVKQCKLCNETFPNSISLKNHLIQHGNSSLDVDIKMDCLFVKLKYPQVNSLDVIRLDIIKKLRNEDFDEFCMIRNHYGYEMSLSDSDDDCEDNNNDDGDNNNVSDILQSSTYNKYVCFLCDEFFSRKHLIFAHMINKHKHENLPFQCPECKLGFVHLDMFQKHLKTQCQNNTKRYKCSNCPGKFAWSENLETHECASSQDYKMLKRLESDTSMNIRVNTRRQLKDRFECAFCQKRFKYRKALFTHYEKHERDKRDKRDESDERDERDKIYLTK